jgi:hypothetical protein
MSDYFRFPFPLLRELGTGAVQDTRNLKRGYFWQIEHTAVIMETVLRQAFP